MEIEKLLDISDGDIAAVVGCGGKTSLIRLIATSLKAKQVLVSTTTKMFPIEISGVDCVGALNETSGKLQALPEKALEYLIPRYDITLLEADGSKGFFAKGWLDGEPVVPDYCTHTIGVVTLKTLGKPALPDTVHRLPEFLSLTGLREGDLITEDALTVMVCAPLGMFKNSCGYRYLVVNRVEDTNAARSAQSFLSRVKKQYPSLFERHIYGSVFQNTWQEA